MTEEVPAAPLMPAAPPVPAAPPMPACNGSVPPEDGPLEAIGASGDRAKSLGTVPYVNAEKSPDAPPGKENLEENRNSLAEDITPVDFAGEKRCQDKREEKAGTLQQGPADTQDTGTDGQGSGQGPGGTAGLPPEPGTAADPDGESPAATADPTGSAAREEEEEDAGEEDTEEDEVQVIEIKKQSQVSRLQQRDSGKEPPAPGSAGCNSPREKPGEQPSLGKKNDISRHSYSRYNTISYRRIRKGNTKQRIDEFESMMHL